MTNPANCFHSFNQSAEQFTLPEKFTFPFCYEPHPLCELAAEQLQQHLSTQQEWQHNFGLSKDSGLSKDNGLSENGQPLSADNAIGKMFGVLVVRNARGELGYLAAFSGKLADSNTLPGFVPPVFDMLAEDSFFLPEQVRINRINQQIEALESRPEIPEMQQKLESTLAEQERQLEAVRADMAAGRKRRKAERALLENQRRGGTVAEPDYQQSMALLGQQSVAEKRELKQLKERWDTEISAIRSGLTQLQGPVEQLREERKARSKALQQKLFAQYRFLNRFGEEKDLAELFNNTVNRVPPAGAGECAAPKLLQYAFMHDMQPLAMAEFWWGQSPKSEIRRHKYYYPSCSGKCQPILSHMLDGIEMDDNPLLANPAEGKQLEIVYQDDAIVVVNKPADFLSVPGKHIEDSVYARMKAMFPEATGSLIVHRLDMSTSGLMVIALSHRAHKQLQKQFISRSIEKRYVALIDGIPGSPAGMIELPMRGDPDDRPRQLVCRQYGKPAETRWEVCEHRGQQTKVYLYPKTGRTHQLRVHCAHVDGLNMPIVGDDLYGQKAHRLHLHADSLTLSHPISHQTMTFQADAGF
jgi:tRNA pseudouridine32 synthase/23S rRNA pseudouridine746 synthase